MNKLGITIGVAAVAGLAVAYALTNDKSGNAQLTLEPEAVVSSEAAASPAPAKEAEVMLEPAMTEAPTKKQPAKTRGLQVTQDRMGSQCKTPAGRVCTVDPQPINGPCKCGDKNGLIIR